MALQFTFHKPTVYRIFIQYSQMNQPYARKFQPSSLIFLEGAGKQSKHSTILLGKKEVVNIYYSSTTSSGEKS